MEIEKLDRNNFIAAGLIESYREEWQRRQGQRDHERRLHFYFSDVSKCDREIYYLFHNAEAKRTIADKTLVLFRNGDMLHEEVQFRLKKQKVVDSSRDVEFGLEDFEVEATGRLDSFVQDNGGLAVAELKAKNPYGFQNEEPEQWETDQLLWYIYAAKNSKSIRERNIQNYGYIVYIEGWPMSDFPFSVWRVSYDEQRIEEIRTRFRKLKEMIDKQELPQRTYERNSVKCGYCRFGEFCWQGVPEEPRPPELRADPSVEKPEQELVQSAENRYVQLKAEIAERETELKKVYDILLRYFKASGVKETDKLLYVFSRQTRLDEDYLLEKLIDKWPLIARPQTRLIQAAIEKGLIDPEVFERSKRIEFSEGIRIKKIKEKTQ